MTEDFAAFWSAYPRRVGKLAALKAYAKARSVATADEILDGVGAYRANLPDDVKFVAHPATWLNQGRWMDEYAPIEKPAKARPTSGPYALYQPPWRKASGE